MTSSEKSLRGRSAAHTRWAKTHDREAATDPGRDGFLAKLEREVDPEGRLSPVVRRQRAVELRRSHMLAIARKSALARRQRAEVERKAKPAAESS